MNEKEELIYYSDPGHSWLAVPTIRVKQFKINPSCYSFISNDGKTIYLEEDNDARKYTNALSDKGIKYIFREVQLGNECFIRKLMRC